MKNTKLMIAAIITVLTLSVVGCNREKPKEVTENPTESQQSITEETSNDIKEETTTEDGSSQENNSTTQSENKNSEEKPKESNKNTSTEKPKSQQPTTQTPVTPPKTETAEPQVYTNNNLGFSITFPASWKDKYTVKEDASGLYVAVKSPNSTNNYYGLLFAVLKKGPGLYEETFDTIPGGKRNFEAKGIPYVIGSTTGVPIPEDDPNYELWLKMYKESGAVTNTLKSL
ncbi:hypothetical protein [Clostridium intestinale]|uniref:hypothetical protein n=1 Tax=Clostridium intestinale TaxID=36845 RepID=UPI0028E49CC9|nr:hypothetical protein [Clostridium intestinale]